MSRYIDVDKLGIGRANPDVFENKDYVDGWNSAIGILEKADVEDAVKVVRCKDCRLATEDIMIEGWYRCHNNGMTHEPDVFCSYGERKDKE